MLLYVCVRAMSAHRVFGTCKRDCNSITALCYRLNSEPFGKWLNNLLRERLW